MDLYIREATYDDMDLLFYWANDVEVRKNSFNTAPILYENHVKWFEKIMADNTVFQYILCNKNIPLGQIRLNVSDGEAVIGYSIAPDYRGKGFGEQLILLMIDEVKKDNHGIKKFVGQVKYENQASARAFEKCGFIRNNKNEYIEFTMNV
jgi:RimJ/RimL family protein N-acetyltransferase